MTTAPLIPPKSGPEGSPLCPYSVLHGLTFFSAIVQLIFFSGLIKDLQSHKDEDADKYLHHLQTYILIGKKVPQSEFNDEEVSSRCNSARDIDSQRGDTPHSLTPRESILNIKSKSPPVPDSRQKRREESILNDYIPLLENLEEIFPYFRLRLSEDGRSRRNRIRGIQQAGRLVMHQKKTKAKRTKTKSGE